MGASPRGIRDIRPDLCVNPRKLMGHIHGTVAPQTGRCPDKLLYVIFLFATVATFETSLGWYRLQKPLKPGNTEKIRKNDKIPHRGLGLRSMKKLPKKLQKWSQNAHFCNFSVIFSFFFGPTPGWGILSFFRIFFVFPGLRGFCILYHPREISRPHVIPRKGPIHMWLANLFVNPMRARDPLWIVGFPNKEPKLTLDRGCAGCAYIYIYNKRFALHM